MVSAWAIAGAPSELGGRSVSLPCGDDLVHVGFCALGALSEGSFEPRTVWTARALRSLCHCRRRAGRAELPRQLSWALELVGGGLGCFFKLRGGCTRTSIAAAEALASLGTATPGALATVCAAAVLGASRVAEGFVACSKLRSGPEATNLAQFPGMAFSTLRPAVAVILRGATVATQAVLLHCACPRNASKLRRGSTDEFR